MKKHRITDVVNGSIADEANIKKDDFLISLNGKEILDFLDYRIEIYNGSIELEIESGGLKTIYEIEKGMYEDIGLTFESSLMDKPRRCRNSCKFCFIDQLPENMRETMHFKDDDIRLSFLYGNYVTLTNTDDKELERIIKHRLSPVNVSVHATEPALRIKIMGNKKADRILYQINKLLENRIEVNLQFVIMPGINDGGKLMRSLNDIYDLGIPVNSISVVPVGLTKFRKDNFIKAVDKGSACRIMEIVDEYRDKYKNRYGKSIICAADELFIKAGIEIPDGMYYDEFAQLENGVGMVRSFCDDFVKRSADHSGNEIKGSYSIITGEAFFVYIAKMIDLVDNKNMVKVHKIKNNYFGESVDVAGLLTFTDITEQLSNEVSNDTVLIPEVIFKKNDDLTLDGFSADDFKKKLGKDTVVVPYNASALLEVLFGK